MSDPLLTIQQLSEQLRTPDERLETVIRRLRLYKDAGLVPYHQIVKGGVLRFRLSEVCEALQQRVLIPLALSTIPPHRRGCKPSPKEQYE
jgi:Fe2+ or Zn2+ uptake regulation protein